MRRPPTILFEDRDVLVISKPGGMVVNRADTVEKGETLQDWVESRAEWRELSGTSDVNQTFFERSGIAHRLDKETSGVMVIGKTPTALMELMRQFKARETKKEYVALVHGKIDPKEGAINLPIGRSVFNRHKFHIDVFGKSAMTFYQVIRYIDNSDYQDGFTLVRLTPKTGRTHQIRVHLTHLGYPLVGDELYGGRKRVERDRLWCPRHFLHAAQLTFFHPATGAQATFKAPLSDDLLQALDYLGTTTE